ncbi:unnamed protein product [Allacma fusca]|uniref:Uncharacterized protein n=1 Tax=Allacma fusca TaxID=39272 RepID=A0A8J2JI04_9HEXA|nr:unnamed protein product [Allacma fusca]
MFPFRNVQDISLIYLLIGAHLLKPAHCESEGVDLYQYLQTFLFEAKLVIHRDVIFPDYFHPILRFPICRIIADISPEIPLKTFQMSLKFMNPGWIHLIGLPTFENAGLYVNSNDKLKDMSYVVEPQTTEDFVIILQLSSTLTPYIQYMQSDAAPVLEIPTYSNQGAGAPARGNKDSRPVNSEDSNDTIPIPSGESNFKKQTCFIPSNVLILEVTLANPGRAILSSARFASLEFRPSYYVDLVQLDFSFLNTLPATLAERLRNLRRNTPSEIYAWERERIVEVFTNMSKWDAEEILVNAKYLPADAKVLREISEYSNLTLYWGSDDEWFRHCGSVMYNCLDCQPPNFARIETVGDVSISIFFEADDLHKPFILAALALPFVPCIWLIICLCCVGAGIFHKLRGQLRIDAILQPFVLQAGNETGFMYSFWVLACFALSQMYLCNLRSFQVAPATHEIQSSLPELVEEGFRFLDRTGGLASDFAINSLWEEDNGHHSRSNGSLKLLLGNLAAENESIPRKALLVLSSMCDDYKVVLPIVSKKDYRLVKDQIRLAQVVWAFKWVRPDLLTRAFNIMLSSGIYSFWNSLVEEWLFQRTDDYFIKKRHRMLWLKNFQKYRFYENITTLTANSIHVAAFALAGIAISFAIGTFFCEIFWAKCFRRFKRWNFKVSK